MNSRERILTTLQGGIPDRVGRSDSIWTETFTRWRKEGLEEGQDIAQLFGFDIGGIGGCDMSLRLPGEVIEETDQYIIQRDGNGVTRKDFKGEVGHTPHWIDHTLKDGKDWLKYKERLAFDDTRVPGNLKEHYDAQRARGLFIPFVSVECYECAWPVFGQVGIFTMMLDEPEVAADVFSTWTDLIISCADKTLSSGIDYDGAFFFGDVGYRNGTLFSPECYRNLIFPSHKRMCDFFKSHNKPVILHSCGKIESFITIFIEAGFSAIQPLEAKTGQDVRALKELHGNKITFFGNMDVRKLSGTREEIEEEIRSKLAVAMRGGGYIFHSDHSVPPTVSFENYRYAMELVDRYGRY
ncbi:MAG: uroporphyrinogen decarboxylase family protein [Armatimonadota bacterium]|nr:uroporphyrinogen decarboxylase family protein [Armatimonadota bacterium]